MGGIRIGETRWGKVGIPVVLMAQIMVLVTFRAVFDPSMIRWLWMADGAYLGAPAATLIWFFARDRKSGRGESG